METIGYLMNKCPICNRNEGGEMQKHHLIPKTYRSRTEVHHPSNRILIHKICHQKIHSTFAERDLFGYYHTVERILEHDEIQKFIIWIKRKPLDFYSKNNDTVERKRKR
jgi:hypothetical protein